MGFICNTDEINNKIKTSKVWILKKELQCKDGHFEVGSLLRLSEITFENFGKLKLYSYSDQITRTIDFDYNEFDNFFSADNEMNKLVKECEKLKDRSVWLDLCFYFLAAITAIVFFIAYLCRWLNISNSEYKALLAILLVTIAVIRLIQRKIDKRISEFKNILKLERKGKDYENNNNH